MDNDDIKQSYDAVAEHFALTRKRALPPQLIDFKQYLADGQEVLDLGCGSGRMIRILKDFEINCVLTDISEELLNYAKKEDLGKIKKAEFITQDMLESFFSENKFDLIFCIATLHHLKSKKDRIKFLKNVHFWLKPGGYFLMTNWNLMQKRYLKYIFNFRKYSWNDFMIPYKDNSGKNLANRYYHSFTHRELKKILLKTGFQIEKLELSENGNDRVSVCQK
ncbi:class I SAM-dependent methyltransferase [bacterium]|nr:class I SAM-dependent methyltransferase [bacterium]